MKNIVLKMMAVMVLLMIVSISCKEKKISVTSLTLNKATLSLGIGKTETLVATISPDNATNKIVSWTSNNSAVATVTSSGLVTAVSIGKATITVTTQDGSKTASCVVSIFSPHSAEPELILVEGGTFLMGCFDNQCRFEGQELPVHQVTLSSFKMARYEVTQKQWVAIMGYNSSSFKGNDLPVDGISFENIQEFIQRLNDSTGRQYRLPTEAEWEYAARGGKKSKGYKYSGSDNIGAVAWYSDNSDSRYHAVGTKAPNELGIYDMSGNVWEWCSDWLSEYSAEPQNNPTGPATGVTRITRGGGCINPILYYRVSARNWIKPDVPFPNVGLRLVLQE